MSQTVERALDLLTSLAEKPATLDEAAARLGAHKSTALRLLRSMEHQGFVYRQPEDHRYRLGRQLFALAQQALEAIDVRRVAAPHLAALNESCGHTVHLAVLEDDEVIYVDKYESRYPVRMYSRIGKRVPMTVAAVAKVLLAGLPPRRREALARGLDYPAHTPASVRDATAYLAELERVAQAGHAVDAGGHEPSVNCVAVPIRDGAGRVTAACSLTAPEVVADLGRLLALLPELSATAERISRAYGGED